MECKRTGRILLRSKIGEKKCVTTSTESLLKNKEFNEQYLNFYESNRVVLGSTYWNEIDMSYGNGLSTVSFYDIFDKYFGE